MTYVSPHSGRYSLSWSKFSHSGRYSLSWSTFHHTVGGAACHGASADEHDIETIPQVIMTEVLSLFMETQKLLLVNL